jgi:hypothetical protein
MIMRVVDKTIVWGAILRTVEAMRAKAWRVITRVLGRPKGVLVIFIVLHINKEERGRIRYQLNLWNYKTD